MDTIVNIGNQLRRGIAHIDLTHIRAPYSKIEDYEKLVDSLDNRFDDFDYAKESLEDFDVNGLNRVSNELVVALLFFREN